MHGVSFATFLLSDIERLKDYNGLATLVEIPCYNLPELYEIIEVCKKKNLKYGLHYPSYPSYDRVGYELSETVCMDIERYQHLSSEAEYFVFHFPCEYSGLVTFYDIMNSFNMLVSATKNFKCVVLIENLTKYAIFRDASHYMQAIKNTVIKLCLDIGHAHMISSKALLEFIDVLRDHIIVVHHYNTSNDSNSRYYGKHLDPSCAANVASFINMNEINKLLLGLPQLRYIVDESYSDLYNTLSEMEQ